MKRRLAVPALSTTGPIALGGPIASFARFARFAAAAVLAAGFAASAPARAADVGVSIHFSEPGVHGRIDLGRFPQQPTLVVRQPVRVIAAPVAVAEPVYLWVPDGHRKNWHKHCGKYGACGVPVYFVSDRWYRDQVRPRGDGHGWVWRDERRHDHPPRHAHRDHDHWDDKRAKHERKLEKEREKHERKHDKWHDKHEKHDKHHRD